MNYLARMTYHYNPDHRVGKWWLAHETIEYYADGSETRTYEYEQSIFSW